MIALKGFLILVNSVAGLFLLVVAVGMWNDAPLWLQIFTILSIMGNCFAVWFLTRKND